MARRAQRFTVYDMMDVRGEFATNPANPDSVDTNGQKLYKGPVPYPKMLYHPEGLERITVPGEILATPLGPKMVGEQRELVTRLVRDAAEEKAALAEGWHKTPGAAMAAAGKTAPPESPSQTIEKLEAEIARLQAERNAATGVMLAQPAASGVVKKPD